MRRIIGIWRVRLGCTRRQSGSGFELYEGMLRLIRLHGAYKYYVERTRVLWSEG
jgi:hypothetical protein